MPVIMDSLCNTAYKASNSRRRVLTINSDFV